MKKLIVVNKKRFAITLICFSLILVFTVGGTLAYLFTSSDSVKNTFAPGEVSTYVEETITNSEKDDIKIRNTGNTSAYIRVAVIQNWVDADGTVIPGNLPALPDLASGWKEKDGFYYCTSEIAAGATTGELFATAISEPDNGPAGTHLQVTILADGIQSQGTDGTNRPVVDAWGVDPSKL